MTKMGVFIVVTSVKHALKAIVVDIPKESKWEGFPSHDTPKLRKMNDSVTELHKREVSPNIHHGVHNRRALPS